MNTMDRKEEIKQDNNPEKQAAKTSTGKRIMAWIGIGLIGAWILATAVIAIIPFEGKENIFRFFMFGCIILPVFLWIFLWAYGAITGRKNIASFRTKEMEETMRKAEEIRMNMEASKEQEGRAGGENTGDGK